MVTKFGMVWGLTNRHFFPKFRELWFGPAAIPCSDSYPFFTDALVVFPEVAFSALTLFVGRQASGV